MAASLLLGAPGMGGRKARLSRMLLDGILMECPWFGVDVGVFFFRVGRENVRVA